MKSQRQFVSWTINEVTGGSSIKPASENTNGILLDITNMKDPNFTDRACQSLEKLYETETGKELLDGLMRANKKTIITHHDNPNVTKPAQGNIGGELNKVANELYSDLGTFPLNINFALKNVMAMLEDYDKKQNKTSSVYQKDYKAEMYYWLTNQINNLPEFNLYGKPIQTPYLNNDEKIPVELIKTWLEPELSQSFDASQRGLRSKANDEKLRMLLEKEFPLEKLKQNHPEAFSKERLKYDIEDTIAKELRSEISNHIRRSVSVALADYAAPGEGVSSRILWNSTDARGFEQQTIALAHELIHAKDFAEGTQLALPALEDDPGSRLNEYRAAGLAPLDSRKINENAIRSEMGLVAREEYNPPQQSSESGKENKDDFKKGCNVM